MRERTSVPSSACLELLDLLRHFDKLTVWMYLCGMAAGLEVTSETFNEDESITIVPMYYLLKHVPKQTPVYVLYSSVGL